MFLLIISLVIFIVITYTVQKFIKYNQLFDFILGGFILFISLVILVLTAAGLFKQMNNPVFILSFQLGIMIITFILAYLFRARMGSNPPLTIKIPSMKDLHFPILFYGLLMAIIGVTFLNFVYVIAVPPNNNDSLAIHIARLGMWHQLGTWLPWNTKVIWQLTFPFNAEIVGYWTMVFTHSERLLGLFPLAAGLMSSAILYQLCKEFTKKTYLALFASLVWLALPVVQLNLTSTRHDHVSTFLFLAAFYFFYQHIKQKHLAYLAMTGVCLGLVTGTNYSIAAYLPGFVLIVLLAWIAFKKVNLREVMILCLSSALAFTLFSSPIYISNQVNFNSPIGPEGMEMTSQSALTESTPAGHIGLMGGRWAYQTIDFQNFPQPYADLLLRSKAWAATHLGKWLGFSLETNASLLNEHTFSYTEQPSFSEDSAWFGVFGIVLFFFITPFLFVIALRKKAPMMVISIAIFVITVPVFLALLRSGWTPYDGRYFILLSAFLCIGFVFFVEKQGKTFQNLLITLFSLIAIATLALTIYYNPAKSIFGYRAFWKMHRYDLISAQSYSTKDMLYLVDQSVPEDGVLGIATSDNYYFEYGLFGESFTRTIIPVYPDNKICDPNWLEEQRIQYILVDVEDNPYANCPAEGYQYKQSMSHWIVLERKK